MNLTTLEQSKKLKEWGAPQDTAMVWIDFESEDEWELEERNLAMPPPDVIPWFAAYDLESLIEWLGDDFNKLRWHPSDYHQKGGFMAYNRTENSEVYREGFGVTTLEAVYALVLAIKQ